jgi:hypothetical protein
MARFTAPQIHCKADETYAREYEMDNGDIVLAFCHATAVETWNHARLTQRRDESITDQQLFPNP